eukprot:scaffold1102_cov116-Isochrysis_galbana.AAC.3
MFHSRPPSFPPTSSSLSSRAEVSKFLPSPGCVSELWEYELYGGAQLQLPVGPTSPVCVCKTPHAPKGVWEGPRAMVHLPRNTRCRFLSPPPRAFLASSPRAWEVCLFLC